MNVNTLKKNLKSAVASQLRRCPPLLRLGSRVYHGINRGFDTLSPGTPEAIRRALELARKDNGDAGDYFEFGVFKGYTFLATQKACDELGLKDTRLYGFDSIRGLPEPEGVDSVEHRFFGGQFAVSKARVESFLSQRGMDWSRGTLVEGYYEDSLTDELKASLPRRHAGVVLLDCDLYTSTATVLAWIEDMLVPGSILLFDDWRVFGGREDLGQGKAFKEFLDAFPRWRAEPLWTFCKHGRAFVMRREGQLAR
jgi:hypothetical protein